MTPDGLTARVHPRSHLTRIGHAIALALPFAILGAVPALAAGEAAIPPPTVAFLLFGWSFDPMVQTLTIGLGILYLVGVRSVDRAHPANPVPRRRIAAFLGGLLALEIALQSGMAAYDDTLFSAHMVQHMLLVLVAAPLLVLGAPITLLLRAATPEQRRLLILPVLHSRPVRFLGHPVVAWILFTVVMWGTHVTPLFEAALVDPMAHYFEHALFLGSALLFWWPVVGADPSPYRMSYPARMLYLGLQMPQSTFLALTLYSATAPLYAHYVALDLAWGPGPLNDQQGGAALMWVWGDLTFLVAMLAVLAAWLHADEVRTVREERRVDAQLAVINERGARHAAALAEAASGWPEPSGPGGPEPSGPGGGRPSGPGAPVPSGPGGSSPSAGRPERTAAGMVPSPDGIRAATVGPPSEAPLG